MNAQTILCTISDVHSIKGKRGNLMQKEKYIFSEDIRESMPELMGRVFTERQIKEVYANIIDKAEYPDFQSWLYDMLKCGLVTREI